MLKVSLPSSQIHPLVRVTTKSPKGEITTTLDDSHSVLEIAVPKGVSEDQIEVIAELCNGRGEPDKQMGPIVLKAVSEAPVKKGSLKPMPKLPEKPIEKPAEKKVDTPQQQRPQL